MTIFLLKAKKEECISFPVFIFYLSFSYLFAFLHKEKNLKRFAFELLSALQQFFLLCSQEYPAVLMVLLLYFILKGEKGKIFFWFDLNAKMCDFFI